MLNLLYLSDLSFCMVVIDFFLVLFSGKGCSYNLFRCECFINFLN